MPPIVHLVLLLRRPQGRERAGQMKRSPMPRPKKRMKQSNTARSKKRKAITDGPQSKLCRESPCCVPECNWEPYEGSPTHPHHWPTVARQGKDSDTSPLCWYHHQAFHDHGHMAFIEEFGVDVIEVARLLAERVKEETA